MSPQSLIPCNDCVLCIAASVLSEIKFVTEQLMKCEGDFACAMMLLRSVRIFHHSSSMHVVVHVRLSLFWMS